MEDVRSGPVCVLGLGLIGGSVLQAVATGRRAVWGYDHCLDTVAYAERAGFDTTADLTLALRRAADADALIVLAVPLPAVSTIVAAVARYAPHCSLTDVVSVKTPVAAEVKHHGLSGRFVGGHPMSGAVESGWAAADAALFRDAAWVVATDDAANPTVWQRVVGLALTCGAVAVPIGTDEHDRAVARISHLPHLFAETLALVGAEGGQSALGLAAGSFRDGTRVAGTAESLVRAMCEANSGALLDVIDEALAILTRARDELASGSAEYLVASGHAAHRHYLAAHRWDIGGVDPGKQGWQARLRRLARRGGVIRTWPMTPPVTNMGGL